MGFWGNKLYRPPATNMAVNTMPLEQYIATNRVLPKDILTIAVQTTVVIQYLHKRKLVLRTLDLNNITAVTRIDQQVIVFSYVFECVFLYVHEKM